jgi:hypothetical protein
MSGDTWAHARKTTSKRNVEMSDEAIGVRMRATYPAKPTPAEAQAILDAEIIALTGRAGASPKETFTPETAALAQARIAWAKNLLSGWNLFIRQY